MGSQRVGDHANIKVPHFSQVSIGVETDNNWEFTNVNFQRDQPDLLYFITRKKSGEDAGVDISHVLTELESIKKHSTSISNDLKNIQRDNQMLWNESSSLRTQYQRQQETIDKIVRFLASLFSKVRF
jgi:FtsZ-binding cell division protein ZapB